MIEELGHYDPRNKDQAKQFVAKLDRCKHWLDVGAIPSETVSSLLKKSGVEHKQLAAAQARASPRWLPGRRREEAGSAAATSLGLDNRAGGFSPLDLTAIAGLQAATYRRSEPCVASTS